MGVIAIGIDSVYQAPSGKPVAFGLIPFGGPGNGTNTPAAALLRPNPFVPVAGASYGGPQFPAGWVRILTNDNAQSLARQAGQLKTPQGYDYGSSSTQFLSYLQNGAILYFMAGANNGSGLVPSDNAPGVGLPSGWWLFRQEAAGQQAVNDPHELLASGTVPALGAAPGTSAGDAADMAWALGQLPSWIAAKGSSPYAFKNPLSLLTGGSTSTVSQVAGALPSNSQLGLYALVAAGLAFLYYELG